MKTRWLTSSLLGFLRGSQFLQGKWYQMMASRFVVDTTQLGQKCTTWDFSELGKNAWNVHEKAHLHYLEGWDTEKDYTLWTKVRDDKILLQDHNLFSTDLWIKNKTDDVLMLMGLDNLTFFILARDPTEFENHYRNQVSDLLELWDYNTYYKTPFTTYELSCIE